MSVFDYLFDTSFFQRADLRLLDRKTEAIQERLWQSRAEARDAAGEARELRQEVSRLVLLLETTQRILFDKGICTREEFGRMLRAVDAEDGVLDGRMGRAGEAAEELRYCNACQHFNPISRGSCQYCGGAFGQGS
ncbi:MAG TPA: hypothetical protein VEN81_07360 [Planctomycetota bacterium]|nr:hypothetical protein [Planctomycetota bacterium]